MATACAEATTWPDDVKLAVNVSPIQFRSGTLALKIVAALAASGLAGAYPDGWAVQNYDAVYLLKAAIEKARTVDTDAVIKAIEGMPIPAKPVQQLRVRRPVSWAARHGG